MTRTGSWLWLLVIGAACGSDTGGGVSRAPSAAAQASPAAGGAVSTAPNVPAQTAPVIAPPAPAANSGSPTLPPPAAPVTPRTGQPFPTNNMPATPATPAVTPPPATVPPAGAAGAPAPAMTPAAATGGMEPVIPEIKGNCPSLESGPVNFMGLSGQVEAGIKPAAATAPMLLYWHGTGSTAGEYSLMAAGIAQGVTAAGGIVVSFQNTTNKGDCSPSGTFIFCTGDFEAMDQYVACAVKNRNVDPHKIYTAGCSAGGLMATAMAAQRSQYIAAAAPNSGGVTFPQPFSSMHTPPLMAIHGAPGSDVVGVDFSQTSATAAMAWKQRGGLAIDCNTGGGHCGGGGLAGDAWKFFQAHPFGVTPEPWSMLPAGFSSQCKIQ